jgi:two-component system NtrC family sensor kinase
MINNQDRLSSNDSIDQQNLEAFKIRVSDSNKALELSKEIVKVTRTTGYSKGLAEGLCTMGFSLMRLSKNEEAIIYLEESLGLFESLNQSTGKALASTYIGIVQRNLGNYKTSLEFLYQGLELVKETDNISGNSSVWYHIGATYKYMGNFEKALECFLQSLSVAQEEKKKSKNESQSFLSGEPYSLINIGSIYFEFGDYENALRYFKESMVIRKNEGDKWGEAGCLDNIGYTHFKLGDYDLAVYFCMNSLEMSQSVGDKKGQANSLFHLAEIHYSKNNIPEALSFANQSLSIRKDINDKKGQAEVYLCLSQIINSEDKSENPEEQLDLLNKALVLGEDTKALDLLYKIHNAFYKSFKERKQYADALNHLELFNNIEKEIHSNTVNQKIQSLEFNNRMEMSKKENEIYRLKNIELASLNEETNRQKKEIEIQKTSLEKTLSELRSAQAQLVQREKMASMGELTAGIAHEIQNPLNFVNNFSEINTELIEDLKVERSKLKDIAISDQENELFKNITDNLEKTLHHGKRADAIVKGMLQHSRTSSGLKELTDINSLADEYLRLSYHGFRAKDKSFNATVKTDFDPSIGNINVIPQDIGRVLLNLINNAFYVVAETQRSKETAAAEKKNTNPDKYEPTVSISTKRVDSPLGAGGGRGKIVISVKDNGTGIPSTIKDKIFQPFFTTKPTGQGTGLGLSLSYDIVKVHGGELMVETNEGEGSEFIISIPIV